MKKEIVAVAEGKTISFGTLLRGANLFFLFTTALLLIGMAKLDPCYWNSDQP
jgi:hypothetical protein